MPVEGNTPSGSPSPPAWDGMSPPLRSSLSWSLEQRGEDSRGQRASLAVEQRELSSQSQRVSGVESGLSPLPLQLLLSASPPRSVPGRLVIPKVTPAPWPPGLLGGGRSSLGSVPPLCSHSCSRHDPWGGWGLHGLAGPPTSLRSFAEITSLLCFKEAEAGENLDLPEGLISQAPPPATFCSFYA